MKAFLLGTLGIGLLTYVAAAAVAVAAQAGAGDLDARLGPLLFVALESVGGTSSITLGTGLAVVAVAGGLVNAAVAAILARREGRRRDARSDD